ncbi:hypothetical protein Tsubulata_022703 [Turnera subulata]|uniref:CCHC-type domain-containing protein n=1 Tax=Turnera subulata TaxID=218843 RepID=A0A9Q0F248_9ROSI|nr:hypothetical protein Tsubulata_022703 [Turnera subulata]
MSGEPPGGGGTTLPVAVPPVAPSDVSMEPKCAQPSTGEASPKSFREALGSRPAASSLDIDTELEALEGDVVSEMTEHGPVIRLSDSFRARIHKQWEDTVIVKLWGHTLGYRMLCNRLSHLWGLRGEFRVIDLDQNYFLVRLADNYDYLRIMNGGPWVILDHYLTVEPWQPNFVPTTHKVTSVVAWKTERGRFAKAAVELDISKPLETETYVDGVWYPIVYESLPQVCFSCGRAGHLMGACTTTSHGSATVNGSAARAVDSELPAGSLGPGQSAFVPSPAAGGVPSTNVLGDVSAISEEGQGSAPVKQKVGLSKGKAKGVFLSEPMLGVDESEGLAGKRPRGAFSYTLNGEALVQVAQLKPKRQAKLKKNNGQEEVKGQQVDDIWAGVIAKGPPIPASFGPLANPKAVPPITSATALVVEKETNVDSSLSSSMNVAFDGAGGDRFRMAFRDLVFSHRPNLVILVEPKILFAVAVETIRACGFDSAEVEEVQGRAGGAVWELSTVIINCGLCEPDPVVASGFWGGYSEYSGFHFWAMVFGGVLRIHGNDGLVCRGNWCWNDWIERASNKPRPFRFQAAWLLDPCFQNVVESNWQGDLPLNEATYRLRDVLVKWYRGALVVSKISESVDKEWG